MAIICLLRIHAWKGCKCSKCGKTREHDWRLDCQRCARCDATRNAPHQWKGCKCSACGKTRDEGHDWSKDCEKCGFCGKIRQAEHVWTGLKCAVCGKSWDLAGILKPLGNTADDAQAVALSKLCACKLSPEIVDGIGAYLAKGNEDQLRRGAAVALGVLCDARSVRALCGALDVNQESSFLLSDLAEALRNIADRSAAEPLLRWLVSLEVVGVRAGNNSRHSLFSTDMKRFLRSMALAEVIHAMGVMRVREAVPHLIGALQDVDFTVSEAAIQALGEFGSAPRLQLEAILGNRELIAERRREAAKALGALDDPEAIPALLTALKDSDNGVSVESLEALAKMSVPQAFDAVVETLKSDDQRLSRTAAYMLGEAGQHRAIEPLRTALGSADQDLRSNAAQALAKLGDPSGSDIIVSSLADAKARKNAAAALGFVADPRARDAFSAMLASKDAWERDEAAKGLGRLGDARAITDLVLLLSDSERHVRLSAAAGLAMLGDLRGFDTLIRGLWLAGICDHERRVAIEGLGKSGDPRAITNLLRALRGTQKESRRSIAKALSKLGEPAVDGLLAELNDARPLVRLHAAEALGLIRAARAAEALTKMAENDSDDEVRRAASAAMRHLAG